jgi:4-carboxymuconolactone decarboxylase
VRAQNELFWGTYMKHLFGLLFAVVAAAAPLQAAGQNSHRFTPLQSDQLSAEQKSWADTITAPPRNGNYNNPPYRAYLRSPELANKLTPLSDYLRWHTSLPARLSEFAILITARQWTAQYEWYAHYPLAIKAGLDVKIAADLAAGKRPEGMKDDETALYDFVIQIYRDKKVSDAAYQLALKHFAERGVMDLIGIIGYYDLVSMTLITMQAEPLNNSVTPLPPLPR